jgi:hypothetical protein
LTAEAFSRKALAEPGPAGLPPRSGGGYEEKPQELEGEEVDLWLREFGLHPDEDSL